MTAGSPRASPALAAQLRAFSVISSSLRAELSTSRNHSVGKVSASPMSFLIVRIRSLDVSGIAEDDGSFVTVHFRNVCLGEARSSTLHRPCGQRSAARHSLWAGLARTSLRFRSIASAPDLPWEEVRLRLDSFDARFILSGSVVHFVTDTSSDGERRRETATDGVPLLSTPSLPDSQSGIATLHVVPVRYAPGASVPPLRLRDLRGVCRANTVSSA